MGASVPTDAPNPVPVAQATFGRTGGSSGGNASSDRDAGQGSSSTSVVSPLQGYVGGTGSGNGAGLGGGGGGAGGAGTRNAGPHNYGESGPQPSVSRGAGWTGSWTHSGLGGPAPEATYGGGGKTNGPSTDRDAGMGQGGNGGHRQPASGGGPSSSSDPDSGSVGNSSGGSGMVVIRVATASYSGIQSGHSSVTAPGPGSLTFIRYYTPGTYKA